MTFYDRNRNLERRKLRDQKNDNEKNMECTTITGVFEGTVFGSELVSCMS